MKVLHVFTLDSTPKAFFDGQFKYLAEKGKHDIFLVTSSEKDKEFCKRNHLTYYRIPIARKMDIKTDFKSINALIKIIKKENFDAVFGHTPKGAMIAMIASKLTGVKNRVYYRHGYIYTTASGLKRFILKNIERLTAFCSSKIINVSPSIGQLAVMDKLNPNGKQVVIGNGTCGGIDAKNLFNPELISKSDLEDLRKSLGITENDFIIGFCGRICKEKGIRELIDGFKTFKDKNPYISSKLLFVGGYDERDMLPEEYKKQITNNPDIILTGLVEKANLPLYYSLMSVFVFPSYREGFGMTVVEAGAIGIPALVSRSHGCVDSIVEGITGFYIDISPEGVTSGLTKLLDSELRTKFGENARSHILENYDHSSLWPEILNFYETLRKSEF